MKKGILLTILALMCQLAIFAQNYDRYNYFHDEAVKLKNEGKLNEAKEKFKKIKVICRGGIPENNDLDKMIRECTTISLSESEIQLEATGKKPKSVTLGRMPIRFGQTAAWNGARRQKRGTPSQFHAITTTAPIRARPSLRWLPTANRRRLT